MALGVYYSLWMECLLTARQPKSCISPAHVKTWSERKNVSFICDNFVWWHVQDLSTRVFPGSGIWLKYSAGFGKRSRDTGFDCFCGRGILHNLGTDAGLGKKTIFARNTGGIWENAKFLYAIRELTATREAGFAKIWKKTVFGIEMTDVRGAGLWWKRAEIRDQDPSPRPTSRLLVYSNPGSLLNIPLTNQTTYTNNPAQLSLIFYSTRR